MKAFAVAAVVVFVWIALVFFAAMTFDWWPESGDGWAKLVVVGPAALVALEVCGELFGFGLSTLAKRLGINLRGRLALVLLLVVMFAFLLLMVAVRELG